MISMVDLERVKVNLSVKDEAIDAAISSIVMGAQNPYAPKVHTNTQRYEP